MRYLILFVLFFLFNRFYAADVNVLDYGAVNNGKVLTTAAIQDAIDACFKSGGGTVLVPPGEYLTGTLNLKSNVDFKISQGAVLKATTDLSKYQIHNEQPAGVFYTEDAYNVSITGSGSIHGQGMEFMYKDSAKVIIGDVNNYIRQKFDFRKVKDGLGDGPLMPRDRYHQMIIFTGCSGVTIKELKVIDAPYWTFLIVNCRRVLISGMTIDNNLLIPNSDGIDIVSSQDIIVSDCHISCGDDAIVMTGYAHHFGDPGFKNILMPCENVNVSNCILQSRSSAIRIGAWDQNHLRNFNFSNIIIYNSNCGINLTVRDSGSIQYMNFSNIRIETRMHTGDWWGNGEPIKISAIRGVPDNPLGTIRDIYFNNITCLGENSILLFASDETRLSGISFTDFEFILRKSALDKESGGNFDLRPTIVKGKEIFEAEIPVVYIENAEDVYFNRGKIRFDNTDAHYYTYAIQASKVDNIEIDGVKAQSSPSNPGLEPVSFKDCSNVQIKLISSK